MGGATELGVVLVQGVTSRLDSRPLMRCRVEVDRSDSDTAKDLVGNDHRGDEVGEVIDIT
jgi:hypothetical protein